VIGIYHNKSRKIKTISYNKFFLCGIIFVGTLIRLVYCYYFLDSNLTVDEQSYLNIARSIIDGRWFHLPLNEQCYLYSYNSSEIFPQFFRAPLYPVVLAFLLTIFKQVPPIAVAVLLNITLNILTAYFIYRIAITIRGETTGLIATFLFITNPFVIDQCCRAPLMTEPLFTFLISLSLFSLIKLENNPNALRTVLTGVMIGFGVLCKSPFATLIAILMIRFSLLMIKQRKLRNEIIVVGVALLTILPWSIRNYLMSDGRIIPLSAAGGINLWTGSSEFNYRMYTSTTKDTYMKALADYYEFLKDYTNNYPNKTEAEWDSFWWKRGLEEISSNPFRSTKLLLFKSFHMLTPFLNPLTYSNIIVVFSGIYWITLLAFCVKGYSSYGPESKKLVSLSILLFLSMIIGYLPFYFSIRYRIPYTSVIISILSSVCINNYYLKLRRKFNFDYKI